MKIDQNAQRYIIRNFPTNGVLRCLSGELPSGKTDKDLQDIDDVLTTVRKVFRPTDAELGEIIETKNALSAFLLPIGAGKWLEEINPLLKGLKSRLITARENGNIESEIEKMVTEIGERIDLKA